MLGDVFMFRFINGYYIFYLILILFFFLVLLFPVLIPDVLIDCVMSFLFKVTIIGSIVGLLGLNIFFLVVAVYFISMVIRHLI